MTLEEKLILFKEKGFTGDPETGIVTSHKGKIMRSLSHGYISLAIRINKKTIRINAYQYIWYLANGIYSEELCIDHINRNRSDDRLTNLRLATNQQNCFNRNSKGYALEGKKYKAVIELNNKKIYLGMHKTPEEAHQAYLDAKKIYHII